MDLEIDFNILLHNIFHCINATPGPQATHQNFILISCAYYLTHTTGDQNVISYCHMYQHVVCCLLTQSSCVAGCLLSSEAAAHLWTVAPACSV